MWIILLKEFHLTLPFLTHFRRSIKSQQYKSTKFIFVVLKHKLCCFSVFGIPLRVQSYKNILHIRYLVSDQRQVFKYKPNINYGPALLNRGTVFHCVAHSAVIFCIIMATPFIWNRKRQLVCIIFN